MDQADCAGRLKNLHAWALHLRSTIEVALPEALAELGLPGEETSRDVGEAAATLRSIVRGLDDVMRAYDLLLEAAGRPRRFDDLLQGLATPEPDDFGARPGPEINRAHFGRLAAELHYDAGWLLGAIHGATVCDEAGHLDGHLDGLACGIEEVLISYDRLQDVLGVLPARHDAYFDRLVILEEEAPRRRPRGD
jgi:hypothetical protein